MFFKDFVSVKRQKIKRGASQTYDTPSFFYLCTHFYFSLPTEKFLRGQGEKYTRAWKGLFYSNKVEFLRITKCEL